MVPIAPALAVIPDFKSSTLLAFLKQNVESGSIVYTDVLKSFSGLHEAGYQHVPRTQPLRIDLRKGAKSVVPLADRAIGNLPRSVPGLSGRIHLSIEGAAATANPLLQRHVAEHSRLLPIIAALGIP